MSPHTLSWFILCGEMYQILWVYVYKVADRSKFAVLPQLVIHWLKTAACCFTDAGLQGFQFEPRKYLISMEDNWGQLCFIQGDRKNSLEFWLFLRNPTLNSDWTEQFFSENLKEVEEFNNRIFNKWNLKIGFLRNKKK